MSSIVIGFSRKPLQAKPEVKAAYDYAKSALSGVGGRPVTEEVLS